MELSIPSKSRLSSEPKSPLGNNWMGPITGECSSNLVHAHGSAQMWPDSIPNNKAPQNYQSHCSHAFPRLHCCLYS